MTSSSRISSSKVMITIFHHVCICVTYVTSFWFLCNLILGFRQHSFVTCLLTNMAPFWLYTCVDPPIVAWFFLYGLFFLCCSFNLEISSFSLSTYNGSSFITALHAFSTFNPLISSCNILSTLSCVPNCFMPKSLSNMMASSFVFANNLLSHCFNAFLSWGYNPVTK